MTKIAHAHPCIVEISRFPLIPYMGMHLSDLTFAEDGSPSIVAEGRINFFKFHLVGKILNDVRNYQQADYAFTEDKELLTWLGRAMHPLPVEQLTKLSRTLEPPQEA